MRVVKSSTNSEGETPVAGSNGISTSNSFSRNSSNSIPNVREKTQSMIQVS